MKEDSSERPCSVYGRRSEISEIKPCPFCHAELGMNFEKGTFVHPPVKCFLSGWEFSDEFADSWDHRPSLADSVLAEEYPRDLAAPVSVAEPVAYEYQHDETGRIMFVDVWQRENGWAAANDRWTLVGPLFRHPHAEFASEPAARTPVAQPARRDGAFPEWRETAADNAPQAPSAGVPTAEQIARVMWEIRREDEDRCDMELEDIGDDHAVWKEAQAVVDLLQANGAKHD
jgi:hypothetical protein